MKDKNTDLGSIFKKFDTPSMRDTLSLKEVNHFYTLIKEQSLRDKMTSTDFQDLNIKITNTLKYLMQSLLLDDEWRILQSSYKLKNNKAPDHN
jgi:hypothetical protein